MMDTRKTAKFGFGVPSAQAEGTAPAVEDAKKTATFGHILRKKDYSDAEWRGMKVLVTDANDPSAAPIEMTRGEYEDMVAEQKRLYTEAVKTNSRYRAMGLDEKQQSGYKSLDYILKTTPETAASLSTENARNEKILQKNPEKYEAAKAFSEKMKDEQAAAEFEKQKAEHDEWWALVTTDISSLEAEKAEWEKIRDRNFNNPLSVIPTQRDTNAAAKRKEAEEKIAEIEAKIFAAKNAQTAYKYSILKNNSDYAELSKDERYKGTELYDWIFGRSVTPEDVSIMEGLGYPNAEGQYADWVEEGGEEYALKMLAEYIGQSGRVIDKTYQYLTDEERDNFRYLLNKNGEEEARKYLNWLSEDVMTREARADEAKRQKTMANANGFMRFLDDTADIFYAADNGIDNFTRGTFAHFTNDVSIPNKQQARLNAIRENSSGFKNFSMEVAESIGQQIPAMALSKIPYAGPIVSKAAFMVSAAGNAKAEALRQGYSAQRAIEYGWAAGASELALEFLLGGIPGVSGGSGGKVVQKLAGKWLSKLPDWLQMLSRLGINLSMDTIGEYAEEMLQEDVVDPMLRRVILQEDTDVKLFSEEGRHAGSAGFFTSLVLNAVGIKGNFDKAAAQTYANNALVVTEGFNSPEVVEARENLVQKMEDGDISEADIKAVVEAAVDEALTIIDVAAEVAEATQKAGAEESFNSSNVSDHLGAVALLKSNSAAIKAMDTVASIDGTEIPAEGKASERILNYLESNGDTVQREGFGEVVFSKRRIKNSVVGHGAGEAKIQLFAAVPDVIANGIEISSASNWKNRGYDSYVFAAPVDYNGKKTYVAVIVTKAEDNRYYLHEAVDEDGNLIYAKEEGTMLPSDTAAEDPRERVANTEPSINSISQVGENSQEGSAGQSRGNVLVPNGDGTNTLMTVEEAERRNAAEAQRENAAAVVADAAKENAASAGKTAQTAENSVDAKTIAAIERSKAAIGADDVRVRLTSLLDGTVSNAVADRIANTPELAAEFEKMAGVKLEGSAAEKRRLIKNNAALAVEEYRYQTKEAAVAAITNAGYVNATEPMIGEGGALGAYGKAAYKATMQATVDAYTRDGFGANAVGNFNAEFGSYYRSAIEGNPFEYMNGRMNEADAKAAFDAGVRDAAILDAATLTEKSGILHGATDEEISTALRISKVLGKDIVFVNRIGSGDFGGCYTDDGNIYLQVGTKQPIVKIAAHEFTHSLEGKSLYKNLRKFVFAELMKNGKTEAELRAEIRENAFYRELEDPDVDKEIVARFVAEHLLTDVDVMRRVVQSEGRGFAEKLHDAWNAFVTKIKSAFGEKTDAETKAQLDMLERGRAMLAEVIKSEDAGKSGGVRNYLNPNFAVAYDNWVEKHGRRNNMNLFVGETSPALQSIGIKKHDIYWPTSKINTSLADHQELTDGIMKQIPEIIENPIIVLESNSVDAKTEHPESNRVVILGEVYGEDGVPIMAVLELEPQNRKGLVMEQIRLISTYTRVYENEKRNLPKIQGTQDLINDSRILYVDPKKNRTNAWLRRNRLQLPLGVTEYGPINKVSYRSDFVNSDFMQKSENDAKQTAKTSTATAFERFLEKNPDFEFAEDGEGDSKIRYSFDGDGDVQGEVESFLNEEDRHAAEDEFLLKMLHYRMHPEEAEKVAEEYEANRGNDFIDRMIHTKTDEALRKEAEKLLKGKDKRNNLFAKVAAEYEKSFSFVYRKMVDSGYAVSKIGKAIKDEHLYAYYNAARASTNAAVYMLTGEQTDVNGDVVGEGLNAIFDPIKKEGEEYYREFQKYLYHLHNVDRMSRQNDVRTEEAKERFAEFKSLHPELERYSEYQLERMAAADFYLPEKEAAAECIRLRDEMHREENMRNKPVFGYEVDASHSNIAAEALERLHPEFKEHRDKIYKYIENLLQYRVDCGLITERDMRELQQVYPHYVPTYRVTDPDARSKQRDKRGVVVGKAIGRAKGGTEALMPLDQALAKLTLRVVREGSKNQFGRRLLYDGAVKLKDHIKNVTEYEPQGAADSFALSSDANGEADATFRKTNTFVIYDEGQAYEMEIGDELYEAVQTLSPTAKEMIKCEQLVREANKLYKALITGKNPFFMFDNFERDLQDAGIYTKDLAGFVKAYPKAWKEMATNGPLWKKYQALGGMYSSLFDYKTGIAEVKKARGIGKVSEKVEAANMLIEQAPRFAEFISTIERGGDSHENLMQAMHNAADITVNFGRSGVAGKWLNETFIPFLNPSIQGFDKTVRTFTENASAGDWAKLAVKALLLGVAPSVLNALAAALLDWEDWEDLKERDKDVNYLIRIGDGKYLKIPKGRVSAALSMTAMRVYDVATGEDVDYGEYFGTLADQIAPENPLERNIFTPIYESRIWDPESPGKTWYGSDIESQRLQGYAPSERYDEKTDMFSRWLGSKTGLSPKKINYLLDSYTGVVGDILLPALVPNNGGFGAIANVAEKNFVIDSVSSNRLNNDFYTMLDSVTYNKNSADATPMDKLLYRYMNKRSQAVSEVNAAIKKIETDPNLSNREKSELLRAQQGLRNTVEKNAMNQINQFYQSAEYFYSVAEGDEEEKLDWAYLMANREVFGAEYAIQTYNKNTYIKAQKCYAEGATYDNFFDYYFAAQYIESTGSEKTNEKRMLLIRMDASEDAKIALYRAYISDSRDDDIVAFSDAGMDFDTFLTVQNQYTVIDNGGGTAKEKTEAFKKWLKQEGFKQAQREVAMEAFKYYMIVPAK